MFNRSRRLAEIASAVLTLSALASNRLEMDGVELASGNVAELVKSFEHVNEILDGFRYKIEANPLNSTPFRLEMDAVMTCQPLRGLNICITAV